MFAAGDNLVAMLKASGLGIATAIRSRRRISARTA
jgi:hypothetical protein